MRAVNSAAPVRKTRAPLRVLSAVTSLLIMSTLLSFGTCFRPWRERCLLPYLAASRREIGFAGACGPDESRRSFRSFAEEGLLKLRNLLFGQGEAEELAQKA
jgi:hypothetical protein